jgi:membrane-associated phospholipid phosphatase
MPEPTWPVVLWTAGALLLLLVLGVAFVAVVVRRHDPLRALERRLPALAPRLSRESWHGLTLTLSVLLVVLGLGLFFVITENVVGEDDLVKLDRAVNAWAARSVPEPAFDFLGAITHAGDHDTLLVLTIALGVGLLLRRHLWLFAAFVLTMAGGQGLMVLFKWLFERARPTGPLHASGFSFPSGHTSGATLLYGFVLFLVWSTRLPRAAKWAISAGLGALIVLVGLSRIVLSVHWVSDVLAGFVLGLSWLMFSLVAVRAVAAWRRAEQVYWRPRGHIPGELPGEEVAGNGTAPPGV